LNDEDQNDKEYKGPQIHNHGIGERKKKEEGIGNNFLKKFGSVQNMQTRDIRILGMM
jgi:hypothetical protein